MDSCNLKDFCTIEEAAEILGLRRSQVAPFSDNLIKCIYRLSGKFDIFIYGPALKK